MQVVGLRVKGYRHFRFGLHHVHRDNCHGQLEHFHPILCKINNIFHQKGQN